MACTTLTGIAKGCDNNIGGIVRVLINDSDNITAKTENATTWEVETITKSSPYVEFNFRRNVGNYTEERQNDLLNGSYFYLQTIMLKLMKREASKSKAINIAGEGQRDLDIVVEDANGKFWNFELCQMVTDTGGSGTAKADGSNYEITFTAESMHKAYEVDPTIIAGLLTA
jgi:hypothetical protein